MLLRVGKLGLLAVLLFQLGGGVAQAQRVAGACTGPKPTCDVCNHATCTADTAPNWTCEADAAGTRCNTGDACYKNGRCDGSGSCVGTLACVPGVPGAISGPQNSATGSYVLSWGASTGVVDQYLLYQNGSQIFAGLQQALSTTITVQGDATYSYKVQACNSAGCSGFTPDFIVTVLLPPAEARTSYTYDSWGNVLTEQVAARDAATDAVYPPADRGLIDLPATTYAYSADGYFRISTTDPLGHTSSQTTDPATGLVTRSQSVQGGPVTAYAYDSLARLLTVTVDGAQPVQQRLSACTAGASCATKRQLFQSGAPVTTEYRDRLGRVIAEGTEGFDGLEIISKVDYNERGVKVTEYPPFRTSAIPGDWDGVLASPYPTKYSNVDILGRPLTKTVLRDANALFHSSDGEASLVTTYQYSVVDIGLKTDLAVSKAAKVGGALNMSRTYDRRGKLVATSQHVTTPTAHDITVEYFYDPASNLTIIRDSAGNVLTGEYDDLGRKTAVNDPDRGLWKYSWDGLSRLRTQTDARGIVIAYQYDADSRMQRRFVREKDQLPALLEAQWQYDLNNKLGTLGALLGVDGFHREYKYDSLLRPWRVASHIPAGGSWSAHDFAVEYGYDHNYGRMKAIDYPSGELVGVDYDRRGNNIGETQLASDGTRSAPPYRHITAMSERGQITAQTFGNGIEETNNYDDSTGMALKISTTGLAEPAPAGCPKPSPLVVREVDYSYDQFLNLAEQDKQFLLRGPTHAIQFNGCTPKAVAATETYGYDGLQRLLGAARTWKGITPTIPPSPTDKYAYDDLGNIISKSDYGQLYLYGNQARTTNLAGPHAVITVSNNGAVKARFKYDQNGNMTEGDGRVISFDSLDRPVQVVMNGYTTQFRYAPDGERYVQSARSSAGTTNEYYFEKVYERIESGAEPVERTYISNPVMIVREGPLRTVRYRHLDRLGSLDAVTIENALEDPSDAHGYDAFGRPRARDWQTSGDQMMPNAKGYNVERGFTGHEHLDELYLIHMNGRMYDYRLGRFLSVDPIISNPASSQSINPYSYIGNNPLSGVDPTGYCDLNTGTHICGNVPIGDLWVNGSPVTGSQTSRYYSFLNGRRLDSDISGVPAADAGGPRQTASQDSGRVAVKDDIAGTRLESAAALNQSHQLDLDLDMLKYLLSKGLRSESEPSVTELLFAARAQNEIDARDFRLNHTGHSIKNMLPLFGFVEVPGAGAAAAAEKEAAINAAAETLVGEGNQLSGGGATITAQPVINAAGDQSIFGVVTGNDSGIGGPIAHGADIAENLEWLAEELGYDSRFEVGGHLPIEHSERLHEMFLRALDLTPIGPTYTNNIPCSAGCAAAQRAINSVILPFSKMP